NPPAAAATVMVMVCDGYCCAMPGVAASARPKTAAVVVRRSAMRIPPLGSSACCCRRSYQARARRVTRGHAGRECGRIPKKSQGPKAGRGSAQLEQLQRVGAADLAPVVLADRRGVEPLGGVVDVLERPVGGEQDAVGADLEHRVEQRLGAEVA